MTTWNYRVMNLNDQPQGVWLEIREVYYDAEGKPLYYTDSNEVVAGDTIDELLATLRLMESALDKPILTPMDFEKFKTQ